MRALGVAEATTSEIRRLRTYDLVLLVLDPSAMDGIGGVVGGCLEGKKHYTTKETNHSGAAMLVLHHVPASPLSDG